MLFSYRHGLRARIAAGVIGSLALTGATLAATPQSGLTNQAHAADADDPVIEAECQTDKSPFDFGGEPVSQDYADYFKESTFATSYLSDYTPQGLGLWKNWRGGDSTEDLFLVGMHFSDLESTPDVDEEDTHRGLLYGMTASGEVRGTAMLPVGAHAGGVKVHNGWVYVQKSNKRILRYSVARIREAFLDPSKRDLGGGAPTNIVTDVSFFDIEGRYLYGGFHNKSGRGHMYRYYILDDGNLAQDGAFGPLEIPMKAQGVHVLADTWIFSTSRGREHRGNIYVVQRTYSKYQEFTSVPYYCFRSVAMIQELVGYNGSTYLLNESGAAEFADRRIHNINRLHVADTADLRSLVW